MVAPIYAFAFTCLFLALIGISIDDIFDVIALWVFGLAGSAIALAICFIVRAVNKTPQTTNEVPREMQNTAQKSLTGNPEVDAVIKEGQKLLAELAFAKNKLKNPEVTQKIDEIMDASHKILDKLRKNPELCSSIQRFSSYYLPTTTKLITNYSYMEGQGVQGGNISNAMEKIENVLDTLKNAYKAQLDSLFSSVALDLESDIHVLTSVLEAEGLIDSVFQESPKLDI